MASLAIVVGLIFLSVLISGPIIYLLAKTKILPPLFIQIIAISIIGLGIWWTIIVPTFVRFFGLLTALLAWKAIVVSSKSA